MPSHLLKDFLTVTSVHCSVFNKVIGYTLNIKTLGCRYIWGGGEQYSYFNLREGGNYPIWVREQGVGRNKSSTLTQIMDLYDRAGGDYHTSYWPQPSFLSSRGYHFELTFPGYSELRH